MTDSDKEGYALWIFNECDNPVSEIIWLVSQLPEEVQKQIKDTTNFVR